VQVLADESADERAEGQRQRADRARAPTARVRSRRLSKVATMMASVVGTNERGAE